MYRIKPQQANKHKGASAPAHDGGQNDNSLKPILDVLLMRGDSLDEWTLLQYIAWFDHKFISEELLLAVIGNDRGKLWSVIENLESLSVVKVASKGKTKGLNLHPGIQDQIVKYATSNPGESKEASRLLVDISRLLNKFLPEVTDTPDKNWKAAREYVSTAESLFEHSVNRKTPIPESEELAILNTRLGEVYEKIFVDAKKGLDYYKSALAIRQSLYKENHPDVASSLSNVGVAYEIIGDIKKGLAYKEKALAMRQSLYEGNHPDVASALSDVGIAYEIIGDVKKGLTYKEKALSMYQDLYEGNHPDVASSLNSVGIAYETLGYAKRGLIYIKRGLSMRQALNEGNHPELARSLDSMGGAYYVLGYVKKALPYIKRGLSMRQSLYEGSHPDVASSLNNLGVAYETLGDVNKGLDFLKSALAMRGSLYVGSHPDVADSLNSVGSAYETLGDAKKGLTYLERGLSMRQSLYGENHPDVALSLNTAGLAYQTLGNVKKGLVYQQRGLAIYQSLYEGPHPDVAWSLNNLGIVYKKLGYVKKGLVYLERGLSMRQSLYEWSHPDVFVSLNNVGDVYAGMGDSGKYNLYKRQASSGRGFIRKRGLITDDIIMVKQKLQKKVLNQIQALSVTGTWSFNPVTGMYDRGVLGYIKKGHLEKQLGNLNNANNVKIALSLCFEAIAIGIANSKEQNPRCAIEFTRAYPRLTNEIVMEHPEYFALESIAATCLKGAAYGMVVAPTALNAEVGSGEEFKGNGRLSYTGESYYEYYNTAIDKILKLRLGVVNPQIKRLDSWYLVDNSASVAELTYKVSNEFSNEVELVIVPASLQSKHWLGLLFRKSGNVVEVIYMDPEQKAMAQGLKLWVEYGFSMKGYTSQFSEAKLERQRYNNCGLEVIENFIYYLTGTRSTQEGAVYLHSLLLENSLLDRQDYRIKLEENNKLIRFLSNAGGLEIIEAQLLGSEDKPVPVMIPERDAAKAMSSFGRKLGMDLFYKKLLYRNELKAFNDMIRDYGIELTDGLTAVNLLLDNSKFNKLVMNKIHPDKNPFGVDIAHEDTLFVRDLRDKFAADLKLGELIDDGLMKINSMLYKSSIGFKSLDVVVDSARLAYEPNTVLLKKLVLDCAHLHGLMVGANSYSLAISGAEATYQLYMEEYQKAFDVTASTLSAMALPVLLAMANRPYLVFAYSLFVAASTAYNALENAYSFVQELVGEEESQASSLEFMAGQMVSNEDNGL